MNSSAETLEATKMYSQPAALSHLRITHSASRKHRLIQGRHCLARTHNVVAAVDRIRTVWRSRGISDGGHRQLPVGTNNVIMISATSSQGTAPVLYESFRYHLATHVILCQVQANCYFRFVHRGLRPKTVQPTCSVLNFIFVVPCVLILGWRNPTRCNSMQIFIYC